MTKRLEETRPQMKPHMIRFSDDIWAAAKVKAGITPLSAIIRQLVKLWLAGEIEIK
jgi:hypothetical protein